MAGFQSGYEKAWETLLPLLQEGLLKSKEAIRREAIDKTLADLQPMLRPPNASRL